MPIETVLISVLDNSASITDIFVKNTMQSTSLDFSNLEIGLSKIKTLRNESESSYSVVRGILN